MLVSYQELVRAAQVILEAVGENPENAKLAAEIITQSDARGISTHGTHMLNLIYAKRKAKQLNFPTKIDVLTDMGAIALLDGNDGLGQIGAYRATQLAIDKAKYYGVGAVLLRHSNNVGALGTYAELIAKEKMAGVFFCNASPAMAPWGGARQFFGTQPFSIGIYMGDHASFVADMATSQVARGRIRQAFRENKEIPKDWALDIDGNPTTDPEQAIKGLLLPMGGPKGSAIAMAIDIIAGIVSGSNYAPNVRAIHHTEGAAGIGCGVIVLDLPSFIDLDQYGIKLTEYLEQIKMMPRIQGIHEILIPGENRFRKEALSKTNGVDVPDENIDKINLTLKELKADIQLESI